MYSTGSYEEDLRSIGMMGRRQLRPVKGPTMKYQGGFGGIRVSPHIYNT